MSKDPMRSSHRCQENPPLPTGGQGTSDYFSKTTREAWVTVFHVRAEAGETNKAEHTLSNGSGWLFKKKERNHVIFRDNIKT